MLLWLYRLTRLPATGWGDDEDSRRLEFEKTSLEVTKFWDRFPSRPELKGRKVLDVGCGQGAMVFHAAKAGASRTVGLDILSIQTEFANEMLDQRFPELRTVTEFRCHYLRELDEGDFDIILSKDAFEHIIGLEEHLREMYARLRPGGRIYAGFAPLYRSIRGDHFRARTRVPWGHVLFPEKVILTSLREMYPQKRLESIHDLGLNKISLEEFKLLVNRVGLSTVYLGINVGQSLGLRLYNLGRLLPGLAEYFTHNVYVILERPR